MPTNCRCDCDACDAALHANNHCHVWPCRYGKISIQRVGSSRVPVDPAHASTNWHNSVKGCVECEWDRLERWCRDNGIIPSSHGPKHFVDQMIAFLRIKE